jgi:molecular chaperone DnaK
MTRSTVDFGIDLGTTNSSIAVLNGTQPEVIKNNDSQEITASAVAIDKEGKLFRGMRAKNFSAYDPDNVSFEFKLQMGTDTTFQFTRIGQHLKPEDLSAEVLKSLKEDVAQSKRENVQSAVITVPAAFELPQCEATRKAAELAGITFSPLLQEPVAAALAYGFQSESDNVRWLAYDLGGGTFDAAVIQVRDGTIQVLNHGGDNHLGGKLIDWAIIEKLLVPALTYQFALSDFRRGNDRWKTAFAKLKLKAEEAKIQVSRYPTANLLIESLCKDDNGEPVTFDYDLRREDVEKLAEPIILRSINICKKVLSEKRLGADNIEKVLLVGGPTLMQYLRDRLSDPKEGLGLPLDFSIDPLTVVARGAAVFAGTQRTDRVSVPSASPGTYAIDLEYKPVGDDPEPLVGGKVLIHGDLALGLTIEFVNIASRWRSGKIALSDAGTFVTNLLAEKGKPNTFQIELRDASGSKLETVPDRLTYTIGLSTTDPPLTHVVGIAMADNEVHAFFEKGTPLPARTRKVHRQVYHVHHGRAEESIKLPVVEGENARADRNQLIGYLEITGDKLRRDIPGGSEIEITIEMDQSRMMRVKAYIPVVDEEFESVAKLIIGTPAADTLVQSTQRERTRLESLQQKINDNEDSSAERILARVENEKMLEDVEATLVNARTDVEAAQECHKRLLDLKVALDQAEDAVEVPELLREANQLILWTEEIVASHGTDDDKKMFGVMRRDLEAAMQARLPDPYVIRRKIDEMSGLRFRLVGQDPSWWIGCVEYVKENSEKLSDQRQAELLFAQAHRSINDDDLDGLKSACRQLLSLLPDEERDLERGYGGTTAH